MDKVAKFQERFNECLHFSNVKQAELARAANVSKQCISDYKRGKSVPGIDTHSLICKFLDVSAGYLLGLEDRAPRLSAHKKRPPNFVQKFGGRKAIEPFFEDARSPLKAVRFIFGRALPRRRCILPRRASFACRSRRR